ncbi:MAG: dCMP deaminase family protein [Clostridia bacterium]|nr:dCMP deaminase family protein [Clostridia bacterium]
MEKRKDYINWDEYFMGVASLSAQRSKDPSTQVGACIVSVDNKILSVGYNGAACGFDDEEVPWDREGDFEKTKYPYICHAELNAILNNKGSRLDGARIYVDLFPCNECAKAIIQTGIKEVIYKSDKYNGTPENIVSKKMLNYCNVKYRKYNETGRKITISL